MNQVVNEAAQTQVVRRAEYNKLVLNSDVCVVGAGISGIAAAIESARLGSRVVLIDCLPQLGGQAYNSIIGTLCGFYPNGGSDRMLTRGLAEEMFCELREMGGLFDQPKGYTIVPIYDEKIFLRWLENKLKPLSITVLLEATIYEAYCENRRIKSVVCANRYGVIEVKAKQFIDASGDVALGWLAGVPCNISKGYNVKGTQMFVLEGVDYSLPYPTDEEMNEALQAYGDKYHLERRKGIVFYNPQRKDIAICNLTHLDTPLDPLEATRNTIVGKDQVDKVAAFLKEVFPDTFGNSRVRSYAQTGLRQTRWLSSVKQLTTEEVREGIRFDDAIARTAWPMELHCQSGYIWEVFSEDHVHYIPLRSLLSPELDNYAAVGRCIDGDVGALSSIRVMGPCMATGIAAAKALYLARDKSIHDIDVGKLQEMIAFNLDN